MMVTHVNDLAEAICNDWIGLPVREVREAPEIRDSRWNTGMCSGVRFAQTVNAGGVADGYFDFFTGVMIDDDSGKQGVLVRLADAGALGPVVVRIRTVGQEYGMNYSDWFFPTVPMAEMVGKIRTLVEIACRDLTREWVRNRTAIRATGSFSPEEAEALWSAQP